MALDLLYTVNRTMDDELNERIAWSAYYHPEWDETPEAYLQAGILREGRSRRLGKLSDTSLHFCSYLGIQHFDPLAWGYDGEVRIYFWVSFLIGKRTIALQTFATLPECRVAQAHFYRSFLRDHMY